MILLLDGISFHTGQKAADKAAFFIVQFSPEFEATCVVREFCPQYAVNPLMGG